MEGWPRFPFFAASFLIQPQWNAYIFNCIFFFHGFSRQTVSSPSIATLKDKEPFFPQRSFKEMEKWFFKGRG